MPVDLCDPGKWTVCELNCRLVNIDERSASAEAQALAYPTVTVADSETTQSGPLPELDPPVFTRGHGASSSLPAPVLDTLKTLAGPLQVPISRLYSWLVSFGLQGMLYRASHLVRAAVKPSQYLEHTGPQAAKPPPIAWHPHTSAFAAATASHAVHVYDTRAADTATPLNGANPPRTIQQPTCVLHHPLQSKVLSLSWRPCRGQQLAVGCVGCVLVWSVGGSGRPPLTARTSGGRSGGPWLLHLQSHHPTARFTDTCWSPDGRLLAAASPDLPGISIWDVAAGTCTQVGAGVAAITLLRWSPCGMYLFASGSSSRLYVWETCSWGWSSWVAPQQYGRVTQAAWAPAPAQHEQAAAAGGSGSSSRASLRSVIMSFEEGAGHLVALHLVKEPPSLVAQLMPVVLQDIGLKADPDTSPVVGSKRSSSGAVMADWAWDPTGDRLAVLLSHPHPAAGCVALYATSLDPVMHVRLLGYARLPTHVLPPGGAPWSGRLAMHGAFAQGALLTVRVAEVDVSGQLKEGAGQACFNLPMLFKAVR